MHANVSPERVRYESAAVCPKQPQGRRDRSSDLTMLTCFREKSQNLHDHKLFLHKMFLAECARNEARTGETAADLPRLRVWVLSHLLSVGVVVGSSAAPDFSVRQHLFDTHQTDERGHSGF